MRSTIFAEATAPGRAGVAVLRVSGPGAFAGVAALTPPPLPPRRASLRRLRHPRTGEPLDRAIVLGFPGPGSFTGEDMVEIQCHGSRAVVGAILAALGEQPDARAAEPGEFTRRALENGRLDLAQVEGLADLLAAETESQRRQAMAVAEGALSKRAAAWRDELLEALALVEATIDFADEGIPDAILLEAAERIAGVAAAVAREAAGGAAAERVRVGFEVALVGPPNVGKSSLLNAIAGRQVAITSACPGTTRDVLECRCDLDGLAVTFLDMAGLREANDPVEVEGVARARERAARADLRLFVSDGQCPGDANNLQKEADDFVVETKGDVRTRIPGTVSAVTGAGVDALLRQVAARLRGRTAAASLAANARQRAALASCSSALERAQLALAVPAEAERASADLHSALRSIDFLVGRVDVEAILDRVFRSFCIGK